MAFREGILTTYGVDMYNSLYDDVEKYLPVSLRNTPIIRQRIKERFEEVLGRSISTTDRFFLNRGLCSANGFDGEMLMDIIKAVAGEFRLRMVK